MSSYIKRIGHIALRARDMQEAEHFYKDRLGFNKAYDLMTEDGKLWITYYIVPNNQFIEVFCSPNPIVEDHYDGINDKTKRSQQKCYFGVLQNIEKPICQAGNSLFDNENNEWELVTDLRKDIYSKGEFNISGILGVSFRTKKYDEMKIFYNKILGLSISEEAESSIKFQVGDDEFIEVENVPYDGENDTQNTGYHHLCLLVDDIYNAAMAYEKEGYTLYKGQRYRGNPYNASYPYPGVAGQCGSYTFYIEDPDGNEIEVMQYTSNSLQHKYMS